MDNICVCDRCGADGAALEWHQIRLFANAVAHSADYAEAAERAGITGTDPLAIASHPVVQAQIVLALKERIGYNGDSVLAVAVAESWGALQAAKAAQDWSAVPRLLKAWQEAQAGLLAEGDGAPATADTVRKAYSRVANRASIAGDLRTTLDAARSLDALEGITEAAKVRAVVTEARKLRSADEVLRDMAAAGVLPAT